LKSVYLQYPGLIKGITNTVLVKANIGHDLMNIKYIKAALASLIIIISGFANAAVIEGTSSGTFVNPVGGSGMVTTGVGTSNFTWEPAVHLQH
jgi:predicted CDP-diglyceride synthetase/phosphatidate cytidylyltransferase